MKAKTGFAPMLILIAGFIALAVGSGYLGTIIGTQNPCYMTSDTTCEAFKPSCGQLHTLLTHSDNNIEAIPAEEYDQCRVHVTWTLPEGRWGNAQGSGTFTLDNLNTISHGGVLGCPLNYVGVDVQILENGQVYTVGFTELGCNMDYTERAEFYGDDIPPPECFVDSDCDLGFMCRENQCIQETPPEEDCYNDADCPEGYVCNLDNECELEPEEPPTPDPVQQNILIIMVGVVFIGLGLWKAKG